MNGSIRWHNRTLRAAGFIALLALAGIAAPGPATAQVAGSTLIGVAEAELRQVALGWSAKHQVLGRDIYNDNGKKIGSVDDLIVSPDKAVSYIILNAGGFIGVLKHDVAIPVTQLKLVGDKLTLPGATRAALEASPAFEYQ